MAAAHEASHPIVNGTLQDEQVLLDAGSNPSLLQLSVTNESDKAPIELLGEVSGNNKHTMVMCLSTPAVTDKMKLQV